MTLGVVVSGAGMAGSARAAAYRTAPTLYRSVLPPLRSVSIVDVVSVLVASSVHRERVEGLVADRKRVLGEKSLSDTLVPQREAVPAGQGVAR
jgi:hypothetical protein